MNAAEGRSSPRLQRWLPVAVLAVLMIVTVATAVTARRVVDDQEERLLGQRVDAVSALLSNSFDTIGSSLRVLGAVGASSDQSSTQVFGDSATTLLQRNTMAVGVAAERDGGFSVVKVVGKGPAAGEPLTPERAAAVSRALGSGQMASALVHDGDGSRLLIAVPVPASRVVAFQESVVDPTKPAPSNPKSPFREVRASLYASPTADPATLVVKTEEDAHLTGNVRAIPFKVGMDDWLLEIGPRDPLV
ncbi:MAG: hypothetical protein QOJ19_2334, partial [Acidimicrobiia bacterium]|nr:hypothetical protein [Acidimicrobiia bacterium]